MLHAGSLPPKLWVEALNCTNHIQNISSHRFVKYMTPYEAWSGNKLELTHLQIFGSCAWARVPSEKRKALDPQSTTCIFVGYLDGVKGYKLLNLSTNMLIIEHNVQFEESSLHAPLEPHAKTSVPLPAPNINDDETNHSDHGSDLSSESDSEYDEYVDDEHANVEPSQMLKWAQTTLRATRDLVGDPTYHKRTRSQLDDPPHALTTTKPMMPMHCYMVLASNLQTYVEAIGYPFWEVAMQEYNSLLEN
jgi:hypothetical protein